MVCEEKNGRLDAFSGQIHSQGYSCETAMPEGAQYLRKSVLSLNGAVCARTTVEQKRIDTDKLIPTGP